MKDNMINISDNLDAVHIIQLDVEQFEIDAKEMDK